MTSERPPLFDGPSRDAPAGRDDLAQQLDALRLRQQQLERENEILRQNAERYRSYSDHLADAVFVHDSAGRFVEVNRQACASLGYTRDELLAMTVFDIEQDVDLATAQATWGRLTIDQRFTLAGRQRRKDGTVFPVEVAFNCFEVAGQRLVQRQTRDVAERSSLHQELTAIEQRYRTLFDVAPVPFALNDASQRILRLNAAFIQTFGYTLEDIPTLADWWSRAYPDPDYRRWVDKTWQQHLDTAARNGTTFEPMELTIRCKDGSQVVALVGAEALAGSADGLHLVMLHDISTRQKADAALRELAEHQTAILDALPAHIALLDPHGVIMAVNSSWRYFASANALQSTDFCVGRNYLKVCDSAAGDCSQEARQVADGLRAVLSGSQRDFSIEYPCHSPDTKRWFRLMATRLHQERLAGVVVMHVNVTDRRLAEEGLRRNTLLLEDSQSTAQVGGWELDLATNDLFWTAETYRIHDTSQAEFNPTVDAAVGYFLPESRRIISLALQAAMELGEGYDLVLEALTIKGRRIDVRTTCKVTLHEGRPAKLTGIFQDITEQMQAAEVKKQLEAQLFQAMKMESLGVLAGGIAHDFNNILTAILGYTNLAMQWNATDVRTVKALGQVIAAGDRAQDLVKQILSFSRRGVQTQTLCDLGQLVEEVGALMQVGRPRNIAYQVSGTEQKYLILGDSSQMHQVLTNLCVNAIQAMPDGGRLAVLLDACTFALGQPRPHAALRDEHYCRIQVQDSGTGIPAHIQARIFEPFFSTKGAQGTGLGLSVVHGIITGHRGAITVDSQVGTGTVFTVYLPTVTAETRIPSDRQPATPMAAGRVLLIAETASLRLLTQDMLTQMGYIVDAYAQPALALAALADLTRNYDLVLSEFAMTELSGLQVCEKLRALQRTIPIGVMAPVLTESDWASLKAADASFILTAPFSYFELAREISQSIMHGMASSKEPL